MKKHKEREFKDLMKKSLDFKNTHKKRADSFNEIFNKYIKIDKEGKKWNEFRIKLRKEFADRLNLHQKKRYALTKKDLKKSYYEIKSNASKF